MLYPVRHFILVVLIILGCLQSVHSQPPKTYTESIEAEAAVLDELIHTYLSALTNQQWEQLNKLGLITTSRFNTSTTGFNLTMHQMRDLFEKIKVERLNYSASRAEIAVASAKVFVTISLTATDPASNTSVINLNNVARIVEFERTRVSDLSKRDGWRIRRDAIDTSKLIELLLASQTAQEKEWLLAGSDDSALSIASGGLKQKGLEILKISEALQGFRFLQLAHELDLKATAIKKLLAKQVAKEREEVLNNKKQSSSEKELAELYLYAGKDYYEAQKYAKALDYLQQSLSIFQKQNEQDSIAEVYEKIALVYRDTGEYKKAIEYFNRALPSNKTLYELIGTLDDSLLDDAITNLLLLYAFEGQPTPSFLQTTSFTKPSSVPITSLAGLAFLGHWQLMQGEPPTAFETTLNIISQIKDKTDDLKDVEMAIKLQYFLISLTRANPKEAATLLEGLRSQVSSLIGSDDEVAEVANKLIEMLETIFYGTTPHNEAISSRLVEINDQLIRTAFEESGGGLSVPLLLFSNLQSLAPDNSELRRLCLQKAIEMGDKSGELSIVAQAHLWLGIYYTSLNDRHSALRHLEDVLAILNRKDASFRQVMAVRVAEKIILSQVAGQYVKLGEYDEALRIYRRALKSGLMRMHDSEIHNMIAQLHYRRSTYTEANQHVDEAIKLSRKSRLESGLTELLNLQGLIQYKMNNITQAIDSFTQATQEIEKRSSFVAGGEQNAEDFFEENAYIYQNLIYTLADNQREDEAFFATERYKSRVLLDHLKKSRRNIARFMTNEEKLQEQKFRQKLDLLNRQFVYSQTQMLDASQFSRLRLNRLKARLDYEIFRAKLYTRHSEFQPTRDATQDNLALC